MDINTNKAIVTRFNREVIEQGNMNSFNELVADNVINHSAPPGTSTGPDSMVHFLFHILRAGFSELQVTIYEQVAERDLVTSRKVIKGKHTGDVFGIPASGTSVEINVIDIIRLKDSKYAEHWGMSNFSEVVAGISK